MSDNTKYKIITAILILFVVLAVFFWFVTKWLVVAVVISEYILQVRKHKAFKIPAIVWAYQWLLRQKRVIFPLPVVVGEDAHAVADLITSISILTLRDFKICVCDGNFTVLGKGTEDELKTAWGNILSQYYDVVDSDEMKQMIKTEREIALLQLRQSQTEALTEVLRSGLYMADAVTPLKKLYPAYAFTKESFSSDIEFVRKGEIHYKLQLERLIKQRDNKKPTENVQSPSQKRKELTALLMDINKIEGGHYNDSITVEMFAMGLMRRNEYIKNMNEQNKR